MMKCTKKCLSIILLTFIMGLMFGGAGVQAEKLRMLVWEGYAPEKWIETYKALVKKKYQVDLEVEVSYVDSADQFVKALKGRKADIIAPSHNLPKDPRYKMISRKLTLPIDLNNIPNYKNIIESLQNADYCTEEGKVYALPFVYGPYGLVYNADKIEEPKSWNILWNPKYAGQYAITGDYFEVNFFSTALAMGIEKSKIGNYEALNTKVFIDKLDALYNNAGKLWKGVDTADDLKGLQLATSWGFSLPELIRRGENWKMANPQEGTTGWIDNFVISHTLRDDLKMKRIAEEWLNLSISPEFQIEVVVRGLGSAPVNLTIKDKLTPEEVVDFHLDDPNYFKKNLIPWPILDNKSRKGFSLIMKKINVSSQR